jgi:hypothetical protein
MEQRLRYLFRRDGLLWGLSLVLGIWVLCCLLFVMAEEFDVRVWEPYRWKIVQPQLVPIVATVEPTMDALEHYHQDHGEYPPTLEALVPTYLAALPTLPHPMDDVGYIPPDRAGAHAYEMRISLRGKYDPNLPFLGALFKFLMYRSDGDYRLAERHFGRRGTVGKWVYCVD